MNPPSFKYSLLRQDLCFYLLWERSKRCKGILTASECVRVSNLILEFSDLVLELVDVLS